MVFGGRKEKGGDGCLLLCSLDFGGGVGLYMFLKKIKL
jgi:hypothetical protein